MLLIIAFSFFEVNLIFYMYSAALCIFFAINLTSPALVFDNAAQQNHPETTDLSSTPSFYAFCRFAIHTLSSLA